MLALQNPLPTADIWILFPSLAVIVLVIVVLGIGGMAFWKQFRASVKEDREWRADQDEKRDKQWQEFMDDMQSRHEADSAADRIKLTEMAQILGKLSDAVNSVTSTLRDHIVEDNARFDVLLTDAQKASVARATQPRRK